jgi:hypothetical protein
MKRKGLGMLVLLMMISLIGWTQFSESVRTVQVLGLFASGVLFGVAMSGIIIALKTNRTSA